MACRWKTCPPGRSGPPTETPGEARDLVVRTRPGLRRDALALAAVTGVPAGTCSRIVADTGCPVLSEYDPVGGGMGPRGPVTRVRYEHETPR